MRSGFITAALAATALAVPHQKKRAVVTATDVDVVYVTDIVTVTAGNGAPAGYTTQVSAETTTKKHWGHKPHWGGWGGKGGKPPGTQEPQTTTEEPAPAPTTEEPAPTTPATTWAQPSPTHTKATNKPKPTQPAGAPPSDYAGKAVLHHNLHRSNHSAPDIKWSDALAKSAADIAASCMYEHNT